MSLVATIRRVLERTGARVSEIERLLRATRRQSQTGAAAGALVGGPTLWRELASQEDLAYVRVSGPRATDRSWPAARQWFTAAGTCEDDPALPAIQMWAVGGACPFQNCAGFVRFCGLSGPNNTPMWLTMAGEWHGFPATLVGPPDTAYSYGWTMVENAPFRTALSHVVTGVGRAVDRASASYESLTGGMVRTGYPTGTHVMLRWDRLASRMWFLGYSEPLTVDGCQP